VVAGGGGIQAGVDADEQNVQADRNEVRHAPTGRGRELSRGGARRSPQIRLSATQSGCVDGSGNRPCLKT
jgi:hypothetical protein